MTLDLFYWFEDRITEGKTEETAGFVVVVDAVVNGCFVFLFDIYIYIYFGDAVYLVDQGGNDPRLRESGKP